MSRFSLVGCIFSYAIVILVLFRARNVNAGVEHEVICANERMLIKLKMLQPNSKTYLKNLGEAFHEMPCRPYHLENGQAIFNISLENFSSCGLTRILDLSTGLRTFIVRVIVVDESEFDVRCTVPTPNHHNITRREVLPAGFKEQEDIESTTTLQTNAPEPMLNVSVKQGNSHVNGELNVKPGTPLTMEIYLDDKSAPIYGLLVSFMRVSDTKSQEETIIFNGCSVDPYLFENFNTVDGDHLTAKFRAFKFPETSYVQFTGTVNICLDKCRGVECSNGQIGFGRRKREISGIPYDPKKVFEVTLTTFLKVDYKDAKEPPYRLLKEKRFSKDEVTVLKLNESHRIPLDEFGEEKIIMSEDDSIGKHIHLRGRNEDELPPSTDANNSTSILTPSLCIFLLILVLLSPSA